MLVHQELTSNLSKAGRTSADRSGIAKTTSVKHTKLTFPAFKSSCFL